MKEYQKFLDEITGYKFEVSIRSYLQHYWLDIEEYSVKWKRIQEMIFAVNARKLPDIMFNDDFTILPKGGAGIFQNREVFDTWRSVMMESGDKEFVVVQNFIPENRITFPVYSKENPGVEIGRKEDSVHRLRFPVGITWDEIMSGDIFSEEVLRWSLREYFVFGDSAVWGRYIANDYWPSLEIIGVKKKFESLFRKKFVVPEEFRAALKQHVPANYQKWIT